jgi:dihydrofolate reductase
MHIVAVAVSSIDGYITKHDGEGTVDWASPEDHAHFVASMARCDASVMGGSTYRVSRDQIRRSATTSTRRRVVWTRDPERYVADEVPGALEFSASPLVDILDRLRADGRERCGVVGGGAVYGALFAADLIDEIELTIEPVVFGRGTRLSGDGDTIDVGFRLGDHTLLNDDTLLLRYIRR